MSSTDCLKFVHVHAFVQLLLTLCKNDPFLELFWSAFSRIRTEYGEIRSISQYSVPMRENMDQNNSRIGILFTQCSTALLFSFLETPGWKVLHWNYTNIRLYLWYWGFTKMLQTEGPCNIKNNAVNRSVGSNWFSKSVWLKKASLKNVIFKWHLVSELCQVKFWWYCSTTSCWWRMYESLLTIFSL